MSIPNRKPLISTFESEIEETLRCGICFDLILKATSLAPCMHSFCGKCISEWHCAAHPDCPICKQPIERAHRNRLLEQQVELFLAHFPHLRRSAEERAEWARKNSIPTDLPLLRAQPLREAVLEAIEGDDLAALEENLLKLVEEGGAREVNCAGQMGVTPLMWACVNDRLECAQLLLDRFGCSLDVRDSEGSSAIMICASRGRHRCLDLLAERGADLNLMNHDNSSPLMMAAHKGDIHCVKVLCDRGANVNSRHINGWSALMFAGNKGHLDCVKELCLRGADVNLPVSNGGASVLMYLALRGYHLCLETLCDFNANLELTDRDGCTALMAASNNGHPECVELLCLRGANKDVMNDYEMSALMMASHKGHVDCVRILCEQRASVDKTDREGKTCLMVAVKQGHLECIQILLKFGANAKLENNYGKAARDYTEDKSVLSILDAHESNCLKQSSFDECEELEKDFNNSNHIISNSSNNNKRKLEKTDIDEEKKDGNNKNNGEL